MTPYWIVYEQKNGGTFKHFPSSQEAEDEAKRLTVLNGNSYDILELIGRTKLPVPQIEVVKLREPGSS